MVTPVLRTIKWIVYPNVYHTGLPYRLPYMVYLLFAEIISPESRLMEEGGAPHLVNMKKYKNTLSKTARK